MIKIVFFSSSEISLALLREIHKDNRFKILGIVTQPDKKAGRDLKLKPNLVKLEALKLNIKVFDPPSLVGSNLYDILKEMGADIFLTFAYGKILPESWLLLPKIAPINIHASILPKYRGASPIQASILNGDAETGISVMKMIKEMDAGPVYKIIKIEIKNDYTSGTLHDLIGLKSAETVPNILSELNLNSKFTEQEHEKATFCKKITKEDGFVDFKLNSNDIYSLFKAFTPWPGIWTKFNSKRIKFLDIEISDMLLQQGQVCCKDSNIFIGTANSSIKLKKLKPESKNGMSAEQFISGHPDFCNSILPS